MTDRELLELIATQVGKLIKDVDEIKATMATKQELAEVKATMATKQELAEVKATMATKQELAEVKATMATELAEVKAEVYSIKATVIKIENDHGKMLGALFDGYKLISDKLDRIEKEVASKGVRS